MASVKFVIAGPPRGKGAPRATVGHNGRAMMHTDSTTRKEMDLVRRLAVEAMAGRQPFTGPVELKIMAWFPIPKSWPKRDKVAATGGAIIPITKPDCSNIAKILEDSLQPPQAPRAKLGESDIYFLQRKATHAMIQVVIADDKQICDLHVWKRYSTDPRVVVEVTELRPEP